MIKFVIFNSGLLVGTILLLIIYSIMRKKVLTIKNSGLFTPIRVVSTILALSLVVSVAGNLYYLFKKETTIKSMVYPCNAEIEMVQAEDNSYCNIYSQYAELDEIPGYNKQIIQSNNLRYTYYLCDYPETTVSPDFIIFIDYIGEENTDTLYWGSVFIEWLKDGNSEANAFSSGDYYSKQLMIIGNYESSIEELQIKNYYDFSDEEIDGGNESVNIKLDAKRLK